MAKHTVQTLLAEHLTTILGQRNFPLHQLKALTQFSKCRTAALGGNAQYCKNGHLNGIWYNSCRHRACPQCQSCASEQWLLNVQRILLDCPHHHIVFTIPAELNVLFRYNRSTMIDVLFKASHDTLQQFSSDKRYLDAKAGLIASLHTWGRNLSLHPHIHFLMTHGGVDQIGRWREPRRTILFPRKPVMQVFRGKYLACLKQAMSDVSWKMPPSLRRDELQRLIRRLYEKEWVVHFCKRYDYAGGVAKYLSRYVKSGPMRNSQLRSSKAGMVKFAYRSHQTKKTESVHLSVADFVQRLIQHIPPSGKRTIRYYGLYHANAQAKLVAARAARAMPPMKAVTKLNWQQFMDRLGQTPVCTTCGAPIGPAGEDDFGELA